MRELLVISHVGIAGGRGEWVTKNRVGELIDELIECEWSVTVVARPSGPKSYLTHRLPPEAEVVTPLNAAMVTRAIARADAALVFGPSLLSYTLATALGRKAVLYAGNSWGLQGGYPHWRLHLERLAARRCSTVVAAGAAVRRYFGEWNETARETVPLVRREIGERLARDDVAADPRELRVLFVGSLTSAKGLPAILDAAEQLPDVEFMLVGAAAGREALRFRVRAAQCKNVSVKDYAEWDTLRAAYEWANVLVLPSAVEGFPRVAYEASAYGAALVLSAVGGVPDRLEHGRDALFVSPNSSRDVIQALEVLRDPGVRSELAAAGRRTLRRAFVHPSAAEQLDALLAGVRLRARTKPATGGAA